MSTYTLQSERHDPIHSPRSVSLLAALTVLIVVLVPQVAPQLLTVSRAIANVPFTAVGVVWGRAHGGTCELQRELIVTCKGMQGGYGRGGTTIGNTWMYGKLDGGGRFKHESRHADQWAAFGSTFPVLYGTEWLRAGRNPHHSIFELYAGLHDGGYFH